MSKHTPGPWVLDNAEGGDWFRYVLAEDSQIGRVDLGNRGAISQHGEANASLIAAAPELLSDLRAAACYIDALGGDSSTYRKTIAKAEGK